jgi:hypothetical protein
MGTTRTKQTTPLLALLGIFVLASWLLAPNSHAYERYKNSSGSGNCSTCHGDFTGPTSPKGLTFPSDSKHEMHNGSQDMNTDCDLCHTSGDNRNPFMGSSNGTKDNTGLGCVGCHGRMEDAGNDSISAGLGAGLRQHHTNAGVDDCTDCHTDADPANYTPVGEDVVPTYYGTVDTNVDDPCNAPEAYLENWTIGDTQGLDNDGDLFYDSDDIIDCPEPASELLFGAAGLVLLALRIARARR